MRIGNEIGFIVLYKQYGDWSTTKPFETRQKAVDHIEHYLMRTKRMSENLEIVDEPRTEITDILIKSITIDECDHYDEFFELYR